MKIFPGILIITVFILMGCGEKPAASVQEPSFTKADSLTDRYLSFQDTLLQAWNMMINDDNQKIKAMHHLLHELMVSNPEDRDVFKSLEERLDQLMRMRYTQKSMQNPDVVTEYDFASNSMVTELISLAESKTEFAYNVTLQKLVEDIRQADQRIDLYRYEYDSVAQLYNQFLDQNQAHLKDIEPEHAPEKRALFQSFEP